MNEIRVPYPVRQCLEDAGPILPSGIPPVWLCMYCHQEYPAPDDLESWALLDEYAKLSSGGPAPRYLPTNRA